MRKIFSVKQVPCLGWSSASPFNLRPRLLTLFYLNMGLVLFGLGESLLIASGAGVSPWTVLAQGIAQNTGWSIGFTTMVVSFAILLLWLPLAQKPGIGTILNALIIAFMIDFSLVWLPFPDLLVWQLLQATAGVLLVGIASGIYLTANLGAGPRDGLMTGLQAKTGFPIASKSSSLSAGFKYDLLTSSGDKLYMRHRTFNLDLKDSSSTKPHIMPLSGFLDQHTQHRTGWIVDTKFSWWHKGVMDTLVVLGANFSSSSTAV